jgi:hypothetical protein
MDVIAGVLNQITSAVNTNKKAVSIAHGQSWARSAVGWTPLVEPARSKLYHQTFKG